MRWISSRRPRGAATALSACVVLSGASCIGGYRAELEFTENLDVGAAEHIVLELPATALKIRGTAETTTTLTGSWFGLGGTKRVAEEMVESASFVVERVGAAARVFTVVEPEAEGLVTLETETLKVPWGKDLSLWTEGGDIDVDDVRGYLVVDIGGGNIEARRVADGVELFTAGGDIDIETLPPSEDAATPIWAVSFSGDIDVRQRGGGDVELQTYRGDLTLFLNDDDDVELYAYGSEGVLVQTGQIDVQSPGGTVRRTVGEGTRRVVVIADEGSVTVRETMPAGNVPSP